MDVFRRAAAEFIGTFALIFVGAGAVIVAAPSAGSGTLEIALAHGLVIAVMVSAVGHISGGHFNPAVTLGFLVTGRLSPVVAAAYWVVQFVSAVAAAALLKWIFPADVQGTLGSPAVGPGIEPEAALIIEAILTFFLVWVVFATAADPRGTFKSIAGLAIGFTIAFDMIMAGPLTGGAMNPARAFGPELVSGTWDDFWIWYIGPFAGGVLGALAYEWLYMRPLRPPVVGPPETGVVEPRPGDTALS
ncbi:MAG TPA: MIP family channel protein [Gaiellaceae bacterium]|nr:MIP family channel protein [Gaiellaceae bacterium]